MKILHVSIESFGKARGVELDFGKDLNVMQNANSFGKTTLASFIRAMLYGLNYTYTKVNDERVNDVTKFCPWGQTGRFGGSMTVEHDNQVWRIERFFGSTARQEQLTVINETVGKTVELACQPGEYFLGLVADSYDRSTYYPQEFVALVGNENLDGRLANLVDSADYDKIQETLSAYQRKKRAARGNGGTINALEQRLFDLNGQLDGAMRAEHERMQSVRQLSDVSARLRQLNERKCHVEKQLDDVKRQIVLNTPTAEQLAASQRLTEAEVAVSRYPSSVENDRAAAEQLAKRITETPAHPNVQQTQSSKFSWLTILAAVLIVGGAALCFGGSVPFFVGGGAVTLCGVIMLVCAFVRSSRKGGAAETLQTTEWDELVTQYMRLVGRYVDVSGADYDQAKDAFWKYCANYDSDKQVLETLRRITPSAVNTDTRRLEQTQQALANELTALNNELAAQSRLAGSLEANINNAKAVDKATIEDEILQVKAEIDEEKLKYDTAEKVSELLLKAKDNLSGSYLPKLRARATELLDYVTGNAYEVSADRNFSLRLRENNKTNQLSAYSRGIREITMLCFRIALSELLYDGNVPLLIVDDAFVNFDEDNFRRATQLLADMAAKGTQVIYFTCHSRLGSLA